MVGVQKHPRFSCNLPGTISLRLVNPMALTSQLKEHRVTGRIAVRDASLTGLSVVFLDLRFTDAKTGLAASAIKSLEPSKELLARFVVAVRGGEVNLPARLVWHRRMPVSRELLVGGFRLVMDTVPRPERERWERWTGENTLGREPAPMPVEIDRVRPAIVLAR